MSVRNIPQVRRTRNAARVKAPARLRLPHNDWRPRAHQEEFWDYFELSGLRGVAVAHRRFGKDDIALNWAAVAAHKRVGSYWHAVPLQVQARKAIWNAVDEETGVRRIDQAFPESIRATTNEQEMFIRFTCGSTWKVVGSDNYNALVGSPPIGVTLSEWALADPAAWVYLSPILEKNGGWASFIYTPRGRNHGYSFWRLSQSTPGWFGIRKRADETGVFTSAQLDRVKAELQSLYGEEDGENLFQQEYMVSFDVAIMGSYYGRIIARLEQANRITSVPYNPNYQVETSWDLGLDDATSIWFFQQIGREVRVIDHYNVRNRSLLDIASDLNRMPYNYAEHYCPHDIDVRELTHARTRKETLERNGIRPVRACPRTGPAERINATRQFLPLCVFDADKCAKGLEALRSYHVDYDDKAKTPRQTPKHDWSSHDADSFGTYAENRRPIGAPRQTMAHSNWDPFALAQLTYGPNPYPGGNPNPIPNVGFKPLPAITNDWDPFDLPEADYR